MGSAIKEQMETGYVGLCNVDFNADQLRNFFNDDQSKPCCSFDLEWMIEFGRGRIDDVYYFLGERNSMVGYDQFRLVRIIIGSINPDLSLA
jgi:hypothetical protein